MFYLYIVPLPQIYLHPRNKTVRINNDSVRVEFMCLANGALSYFWLKENGSISSTAEGINTNNLLLQNILPSDSGHYQCVAVNENGRSFSNSATLTVEGTIILVIFVEIYVYILTVLPPEVHISPTEVQTTEGKTVELFCRAHGLGANSFTYQWFFNDLPVTGQTTPNLVISEVSEGNAGDYVCFVRNSYGGIGQSEIARLILGTYIWYSHFNKVIF